MQSFFSTKVEANVSEHEVCEINIDKSGFPHGISQSIA